MARPLKCRRVGCRPAVSVFKPQGTALDALEVIVLRLDELEAIRLADLEGLYQADAAERMGISRQTFASIATRARRKVTQALVGGMALCIACDDDESCDSSGGRPRLVASTRA